VTTKIDLDDLERKATASTDELGDQAWRVYQCRSAGPGEACGIKDWPFVSEDEDACQQGVVFDTSRDECHHHMALADAAHIAANSPPVTLALIARIRELESAYGQIVDDHVRNESDADALAMQALLDKGAVLP
jgi:hypothetical protein